MVASDVCFSYVITYENYIDLWFADFHCAKNGLKLPVLSPIH